LGKVTALHGLRLQVVVRGCALTAREGRFIAGVKHLHRRIHQVLFRDGCDQRRSVLHRRSLIALESVAGAARSHARDEGFCCAYDLPLALLLILIFR